MAQKAVRGILTFFVSLLPCLFAAGSWAQSSQELEPLRRMDAAVDALVKRVSPSVVQIVVTSFAPLEDSKVGNAGAVLGRQRAIGSGFIIDPEGYIITNAHVVRGAQKVEVVLPTSRASGEIGTITTSLSTQAELVPARIVGVTTDIDLALLKIEGKGYPALPFAAYRSLRQGEAVFAFGSPQGLRNSISHGIISAVARQVDPDSPRIYIQTDTPINPGNSGGPLVNTSGEVVGVNTFILSQSGGNEGLGFAIPCATVRVVARQLKQFGRLRKEEVGIGIQTLTPTMAAGLGLPRNHGVVISDVLPGGPAEAAGLMVGDILLTVDDQPVENLPSVSYYFLSQDLGDKVKIGVLRGKSQEVFNVAVSEETTGMDQVLSLADAAKNMVPGLGIIGLEIDKKVARMVPGLRDPYGIIVAARAEGPGSEVPLQQGDVIRALNGEPMTTLDKLRAAVTQLPSGAPATLQIQRDGKLMFVAFTKQ
ncbi:MAG TPA: trypsin-like peptidase domain-containing protein [Candidatus Eisenbacteria bacterium]|nr:trypsin-like peptidase domain-containing protein [Candidatus Eisenbacteria bacterium]